MQTAIASLHDEPVVFLAVGDHASEEWQGRGVVRYVPRQDEATLALYYQAADVYVHAARAETFGLVIAEAMACGTPVVATAVGGIPEVVIHRQTGLLTPPGDARAFAAALCNLLADKARREAFGAAAAVSAERRFDLARMVDAYIGWYAEVLSERARNKRAL